MEKDVDVTDKEKGRELSIKLNASNCKMKKCKARKFDCLELFDQKI